MKFGPVGVPEAEGATLAHALALPGGRIAKGKTLTDVDVARIAAAGLTEVIAAVLDAGDLPEDEAARRLGEAAQGPTIVAGPAGTGRVNLFAGKTGLFLPDRAVVDRLNAIDPGITLATLREFEPVDAGRMVATVKIIPLAVPGVAVAAAEALVAGTPAFRIAPYRPRRVALVQTELPGTKGRVLDKTRAVLEARLSPSGSTLVAEARCAHEAGALVEALAGLPPADLVIVFGASAVIDAGDVIPAAVLAAGGAVAHLGMPVDPGNLLLLGRIGEVPVIGAPGCARSSKENGFDWVLNRLMADIPVTGEDIRAMGVGGLLMEIATRPQPREMIAAGDGANVLPVVDAVILAAGRSSRMGGPHKLLATFEGVPLVRRMTVTAIGSAARRVRVVVGHGRADIVAALGGLDVEIIDNPRFGEGLSSSLQAGFRACLAGEAGADGVLVMLADQPFVTAVDIDRLIDAFAESGPGAIVAASSDGKRGNPVVLPATLAGEIAALSGDVGAKPILARHAEAVRSVEIGAAAAIDVDTPEAVQAAGGILAGFAVLAQ